MLSLLRRKSVFLSLLLVCGLGILTLSSQSLAGTGKTVVAKPSTSDAASAKAGKSGAGAAAAPDNSVANGPLAPGWELQQWHRMAGRMRLISNKYGGKFETTHYTLLKPEPGNTMYFLNQQTKKYVSYSVDQWRKKFNFYHKDPGRAKDSGFTEFSAWKHVGDEKIAGLKVGRYARFRTNNLPAPNDKTYVEEWSFCKDLKVPLSLVELYKKTLYMTYDEKLGFPMRVKETREWNGKKNKKVDISYDTVSYKKESFPQKFFVLGKDYRAVKDEMSVLMDEGGDGMGLDMPGMGGMPGADGMGVTDIQAELKRRLK